MLILGSLPGEASLAARQYYAHPRNQFWQLMGAVIGDPELAGRTYPARLERIAASGIGLWDVIASAERRGSLDTAIRSAELAPLAVVVASLPGLRAVAFNGAKSAVIGRKVLTGIDLPLIDLPSSSPAHAALSLAAKCDRWLTLKQFIA